MILTFVILVSQQQWNLPHWVGVIISTTCYAKRAAHYEDVPLDHGGLSYAHAITIIKKLGQNCKGSCVQPTLLIQYSAKFSRVFNEFHKFSTIHENILAKIFDMRHSFYTLIARVSMELLSCQICKELSLKRYLQMLCWQLWAQEDDSVTYGSLVPRLSPRSYENKNGFYFSLERG